MLLRARRFNFPTADTLSSMQREMENLFGHVLSDTSGNGTASHGWRAPMAVWDDADKIYVEFELPGVSKDTIDITVHKGQLRVTGERKAPEGERKYWVNDRCYGPFDRTLNLPDDVDSESVDARFTDGVLQLVVSKRPEAQPKKVELKS